MQYKFITILFVFTSVFLDRFDKHDNVDNLEYLDNVQIDYNLIINANHE